MNPSSLAEWLERLQGPWVYLGVFLVAFAEHALAGPTVRRTSDVRDA